MIGKENIEEKIFDYFEGDLSASEAQELENFIQKNPEYQVDFDAWKQSKVSSESHKYRFTDELLINEKNSSKGWFRWASGGALLCLISFASVGLVNKFSDGEGKVSVLINDSIESNKEFLYKDVNALKKSSLGFESQLEVSSKAEINANYKYLNVQKISVDSFEGVKSDSKSNFSKLYNSGIINKKSIKNKNYVKESINNSNNAYKPINDGLLDKKENFEKFDYLDGLKVSYLKEEPYSYTLDIVLKKVKLPYENPNHPSIFFTNRKDPYLNYAIAHTLEENASFAGNGSEGIRSEFLYRTEWPSVSSDNFTSQIISIDGRVDALKGGVGIIINADRIGHGKLNTNAASMIYSPKFVLKGVSIEPSFKYTYNQKNISWNQVEENDVKDPRNGVLYASIPYVPENVRKTTLFHHDLGLGMLINTNKFFIGGQLDHLNNPSYSNVVFDQKITIPAKISVMAGADILKKKDGDFVFSPSLNFIKYGNYTTLWTNTQFSYQGFFFAGGIATNEEFMASLGYGNGKVRLAYGLGFTIPREFSGLELTDTYYESHQISVRVHLQPK